MIGLIFGVVRGEMGVRLRDEIVRRVLERRRAPATDWASRCCDCDCVGWCEWGILAVERERCGGMPDVEAAMA